MIPFEPLKSAKRCPVCNEQSVSYVGAYPSEVEPFASTTIEYCTECGLSYVPKASEILKGYYDREYSRTNRKDRQIPPSKYFSQGWLKKSKKLDRYFKRGNRQIQLLKKLNNPVESLLDFGSGPGYLLHLSNAKRIAAFEPDRDSVKYLKYLRAKLYKRIDRIPEGTFDAVVCSHSLEHLDIFELDRTLRKLLNALKPDGHLLIEVPQGGLSHLILNGRHDPHTIFFSNESLKIAVEAAGADVVFSKCFARREAERRPDAIYKPDGDEFVRQRSGAVTIVARPNNTAMPTPVVGVRGLLNRIFGR